MKIPRNAHIVCVFNQFIYFVIAEGCYGSCSATLGKKQNVVGKPEDYEVRNLTGTGDVVSYSGYLLINKKYNSNMFFWFFPAQLNPDTAPLLIWLEGGLHASALFSLLNQNGPFYIDKNKKLNLRKANSWTLNHSVIYFDSPVGNGYSYTDSEYGHARSEDDISRDLYTALIQFFTVFPKYSARELFICSETYSGKIAAGLAYKIHLENKRPEQLKINLKGMTIANAFVDPVHQIGFFGEVYYNFGFLDRAERRRHVEEVQELIKLYIFEQKWAEALDIYIINFRATREPIPTTYYNNTM